MRNVKKLYNLSMSKSTFLTKHRLHVQRKDASQASCCSRFLTDWLQTSGIYTLQIKTHAATQVRSNMHHRW